MKTSIRKPKRRTSIKRNSKENVVQKPTLRIERTPIMPITESIRHISMKNLKVEMHSGNPEIDEQNNINGFLFWTLSEGCFRYKNKTLFREGDQYITDKFTQIIPGNVVLYKLTNETPQLGVYDGKKGDEIKIVGNNKNIIIDDEFNFDFIYPVYAKLELKYFYELTN